MDPLVIVLLMGSLTFVIAASAGEPREKRSLAMFSFLALLGLTLHASAFVMVNVALTRDGSSGELEIFAFLGAVAAIATGAGASLAAWLGKVRPSRRTWIHAAIFLVASAAWFLAISRSSRWNWW